MEMALKDSKQTPTEVTPKAKRRSFTAKYKLGVLRRVDECKEPGSLSELLRKEGLYSSHLAEWRKARAAGEFDALTPKKRGPKTREVDPRDREMAEMKRENAKLKARAERAEALVEIQKKVAALLGEPLDDNGEKR